MTNKRIWQLLFVLYCAAMLWLLLGRAEAADTLPYFDQLSMRLNLIPFRTLRHQLRLLTNTAKPWLIRHAAINLGGNVVLFVPLGIFLPKLFPRLRKFWKVLAVTAGIIVAVEAVQVLTLLGRCDIDDLILNLLGCAMGYGAYRQFLQE